MPPSFPALESPRINTQPYGHLSLRQTERPACGSKAIGKRVAGGLRVVPEKLDDGGNVSDRWTGCVAFPVRNRGRVNADLLRYV